MRDAICITAATFIALAIFLPLREYMTGAAYPDWSIAVTGVLLGLSMGVMAAK